jgi:protein OS-9
MRKLYIYLSALSALESASALRIGASQLRDLQAYPKYELQFLNDLPLSSTDAERCKDEGIARAEDWQAFKPIGKRRVGDGKSNPSAVNPS